MWLGVVGVWWSWTTAVVCVDMRIVLVEGSVQGAGLIPDIVGKKVKG